MPLWKRLRDTDEFNRDDMCGDLGSVPEHNPDLDEMFQTIKSLDPMGMFIEHLANTPH